MIFSPTRRLFDNISSFCFIFILEIDTDTSSDEEYVAGPYRNEFKSFLVFEHSLEHYTVVSQLQFDVVNHQILFKHYEEFTL